MAANQLIRVCFVIFAIAFAGFLATGTALAQAPEQVGEQAGIAERLSQAIVPFAKSLENIERRIGDNQLSEGELTDLRIELDTIREGILERVIAFQPELNQLNSRIDLLPPVPKEGEPEEPEEIAQQRRQLLAEKAKTTIAVKEAEALSVKSAQLVNEVLSLRRGQFVSALLERRQIDGPLFREVLDGAPGVFRAISSTLGGWFNSLLGVRLGAFALVLGIAAIVAAILGYFLRPLRRWRRKLEAQETTAPVQRLTFAFTATVFQGLAFAILMLILHRLFDYFDLFRFRVADIFGSFLFMLTGIFFVYLLLKAILSPGSYARRLLFIDDGAARRLYWLGMIVAVIYGFDYLLSELFSLFSAPISFTVVKSLAGALLIAVILIAVVGTPLKDRVAEHQPVEQAGTAKYRGWHPALYWLIWISVVALVLTAVLGYISLARFLAGQIVVTGSILTTMYVGYSASRAIGAPGAVAQTIMGRAMQERGTSEMRLDQIGLVLSLAINAFILLIGIPALLLQWGFRGYDVYTWVSTAFTGFEVGGFRISISRLLFAALVFFLLVALTRFVQRWFDSKILSRTQIDAGVQNSIRSGLGYVGFILAGIVAFSFAGFNLSNLALIAGALSVGIGFGLQNIVNNFVSGIIMLIERPIKVGDIIAVGSAEGFVKKINVRATEVETFDRQMVIIPNSEFINTSVGNWMHTDRVRRVVIRVGVAYGSDTEKIRELLLGVCKDDKRIATNPPPFVYFADFGASSLDFELRLFIRDIMETPFVESDLRFAVDRVFRENGIEIPFPQRDLHLRSVDAAVSGLVVPNKPGVTDS